MKSLKEILTSLVKKVKSRNFTGEDELTVKEAGIDFNNGLSNQEKIRKELLREITETNKSTGHEEQKKPVFFHRLLYAVAAIIILSAGSYVVYKISGEINSGNATNIHDTAGKNDLKPGSDRATLTLADGTIILLDSAQNGNLVQQGNTQVLKQDGQIAYNQPSASKPTEDIKYNTITTPRGGQYQVVLPDGSKVWLNAASSLRFPAAFSEKERSVTLTGEGYFEIAKNTKAPFNVFVNQMRVDVLGTHFNINAYEDEKSIKTTLLEGSVKVSSGDQHETLQPCQEVQLTNQDKLTSPVKVDVYASVAWKEGYFYFKKANIEYIMKQLSRWYNVDISYEGKIPRTEFSGEIPKNSPASEVLTALKALKINFRIIGDKNIVVMP